MLSEKVNNSTIYVNSKGSATVGSPARSSVPNFQPNKKIDLPKIDNKVVGQLQKSFKNLFDREKRNKNKDASFNEDAPTNSVGAGNIAGVGVGPQGEPGVNNTKKKKHTILTRKLGLQQKNRQKLIVP